MKQTTQSSLYKQPMATFAMGLLWTGALIALLLNPHVAAAQGAVPYLPQPLDGCYDVVVYGVGLYDGGQGQVTIQPPPGEIVLALMEWVGVEDTTPGGVTLDGTSTLTIDGQPVIGSPAEPLQWVGGKLMGNAAYDPQGFADVGPNGWFAWNADIGPGGLDIIPAQMNQPVTLQIADWNAADVNGRRARQTNGASITIVYRTDSDANPGVCSVENKIQILTGIDTYHQSQNQDISELLVFDIDPAPIARTVRMYFSHAGTDRGQQECRGGAIWMAAGDSQATRPGSGFFVPGHDIVAIGDTNQDGVARGYGINGGVEIVNDPFTSPSLPCTPTLNPAPDETYEADHPYPDGASNAPYRSLAMVPETGGDIGWPGEWGVVEMRVVVPPNTEWMAFQLESERDQNGESGGWVGNGVFAVIPTSTLGDRVWEDLDGDGIQDAGEPGIADVTVHLYDDADHLLDSTVTNTNGLYQFTDLATADYILKFVKPNGFAPSPQNAGGPGSEEVDSDADPITGRTGIISPAPSEVDLSWDAGFYRPVTLGDTIWIDVNRNGIQDGGEPGLNGVTVRLHGAGSDDAFGTGDDITRQTITATSGQDDGRYLFEELPPGRYRLTFDRPAGYRFTPPNVGDDDRDSDADPTTGETAIYTLTSGERNLSIDAGLIRLTSSIRIQKLPDLQKIARGATVSFQLIVHNDGDNPLHNVTVSDPLAPDCDADIGDLNADAQVTYGCSLANVDEDFVNVAMVSGQDEFGAQVSDQDDALVDVLPTVELTKSADPIMRPEPGGDFSFTLAIHNTASEPVTITALEDTNPLSQACLDLVGETLAVDETRMCSYGVRHTEIAVYENVAAVTVEDDEGNPARADDQATVEVFDVPPTIIVVKEADPGLVLHTGEQVTFTVNISNTAIEDVTLFFLEDDIHGPLDGQGSCVLPQTMPVGGGYTCEFTAFVIPGEDGEIDTVTAKARDNEGNVASDSDTATVLPLTPRANSRVGDYVWLDANVNGIQDEDESGVSGVRVELFKANGQLAGTTETDANGLYLFTDLIAGDYYVVVTPVVNGGEFVGFSSMYQGDDPTRDSDVYRINEGDVIKGRTEVFTLPTDTEDRTRDAGLIAPTAINLVSFTAEARGDIVMIEWVTETEVGSLGYHLFRSTSPLRSDAVAITRNLIPSQGSDGGVYTFSDGPMVGGVTFYYWLREVTGDDFTEYGPVSVTANDATNLGRLFLPLIRSK
jgi:uncharacterized repeat protein (TIGR01451 family)